MKNNNLGRFFKIAFKKNKYIAIVAFIMMICTSAMELYIPQITKKILDDAIKLSDTKLLLSLIIIYIGINLFINIISIVLDYIYSIMKNRVSMTFKIKLVRHIAKLSGNYYTNIKTGNILNIMDNDMYIVESLGANLLFSLIIDIFTALIAFFFLLRMQYDLLTIVIVIQIIILFTQSKFTKSIASKNEDIRECSGDISNINQEYVSNIMNVIISKANSKYFKKYISKERNMLKKIVTLDMVFSTSIASGSILNSFIAVTIYGLGGYKIIKGTMSFGELLAFQQYTSMLIGPCMGVIRSNIQIQQAKTSVNRIFSILDEAISITNNNKGIVFDEEFNGNIKFDNVSFSYNNKDSVLDNINLKFNNGETTALVGSSGCGKSTITKLLFRLWDVNNGDITIDGKSLKDYNLKNIRSNIEIITQDTLLFDDTIENNIVLDNKNFNKEYMLKVCDNVGVNEIVNTFPDGFNTVVGERGIKLSGGQKQRIALARALLSDSKIIIFDEATSALDNISQSKILENIKDFLSGKTVIVIAHRLSTIKSADRIYVIDRGKVFEEGSHEELVIKEGVYYSLLQSQEFETVIC